MYIVMKTITTDVLLILLMGIGNVACICLSLIVMEVTKISWTFIIFTLLMQTILIILYKTDYDL